MVMTAAVRLARPEAPLVTAVAKSTGAHVPTKRVWDTPQQHIFKNSIKFMTIAAHKAFRERVLLNKATGKEWYEAKDDDWSKGYVLIEHFVLKHSGKYEIRIGRAVGSQHSNGWLYNKTDINVSE